MISDINTYQYELKDVTLKPLSRLLTDDYGYSSRLLRRIKRNGQVLVNGKECWLCDNVGPGDVVQVTMPEEALDVEPVEGPLSIVYEDDEVLVVNKDAFCVTHPTRSHQLDTLSNRVAWYWQQSGQTAKVRFVNRLDRDTSGIVIIAKNNYVHHYIQSGRHFGKAVKTYLAFVNGGPEEEVGTINAPIARRPDDGIYREVSPDGKPCVTHYKVLERYKGATLLRLGLETGRTHQLRVHLQYMGWPIIGDPMYGMDGQQWGMERQALHAAEMELQLPKSGIIRLRADLKPDMLSLWEGLRNNK